MNYYYFWETLDSGNTSVTHYRKRRKPGFLRRLLRKHILIGKEDYEVV